MGNIEEIDEEVSSESSVTFNICCDNELEELMFIQPYTHIPEENAFRHRQETTCVIELINTHGNKEYVCQRGRMGVT